MREAFDAFWARAQTLSERWQFLRQQAIECPTCKSDQVQLIASDGVPAKWKCRKCTRTFVYEPRLSQ